MHLPKSNGDFLLPIPLGDLCFSLVVQVHDPLELNLHIWPEVTFGVDSFHINISSSYRTCENEGYYPPELP